MDRLWVFFVWYLWLCTRCEWNQTVEGRVTIATSQSRLRGALHANRKAHKITSSYCFCLKKKCDKRSRYSWLAKCEKKRTALGTERQNEMLNPSWLCILWSRLTPKLMVLERLIDAPPPRRLWQMLQESPEKRSGTPAQLVTPSDGAQLIRQRSFRGESECNFTDGRYYRQRRGKAAKASRNYHSNTCGKHLCNSR